MGQSGTGEDLAAAGTPALDYATLALRHRPSAEPLLQLLDYWNGKSHDQAIPTRDAIHPEEIVQHLPWVFMVDVLEGGADYRYRLLGTGIVSANYRDATGHKFSELYGARPVKLAGARLGFDHALATRAPAFTQGRAFWRPDWAFDRFEAAFFPLSTDGNAIDIIFGEIAYLTA